MRITFDVRSFLFTFFYIQKYCMILFPWDIPKSSNFFKNFTNSHTCGAIAAIPKIIQIIFSLGIIFISMSTSSEWILQNSNYSSLLFKLSFDHLTLFKNIKNLCGIPSYINKKCTTSQQSKKKKCYKFLYEFNEPTK